MLLHIYTLEKTLYEGEVNVTTLPAEDGEISVLPNHATLVASLKSGTIIAKDKNDQTKISVSGGFVQITGERITVLASRVNPPTP